MVPIEDLKRELCDKVPLGIDVAIQALKLVIPMDVPKYQDVILLESRYRELNQQLVRGVLSNEDAQIAFNQIREAILQFITDLQQTDFVKQAAVQAAAAKAKKGKVLYRIPDRMQVQKEVKCIIRIAFNEVILLTDIERGVDDLIKDVRIADVMGVELLDPNEQKAFAIRTFSEEVQMVSEEDFTEWLFYVKPLLEGIYPLLVKVAVVEIIDGLERRREVVLEEMVQVIAVEVREEKTGFADAGVTLETAAGQGGSTAGPAVGGETIRKASKIGVALLAVGIVMAILAYFIFVRIENPTDTGGDGRGGGRGRKAWERLRHTPDSMQLKDFLEDFPNTVYADSAQNLLESLRFTFDARQQGDSIVLQTTHGAFPLQVTLLKDSQLIVEQLFYDTAGLVINAVAAGLASASYELQATDANGANRTVVVQYEHRTPTPIVPVEETTAPTDTVTVEVPGSPKPAPGKPKPKPKPQPNKPKPQPIQPTTANQPNQPEVTPTAPVTGPVYTFQNVARQPIYQSCNTRRLQQAQGERLKKALARARECTEQEIRNYIENELTQTPEVRNNRDTKNVQVVFLIGKDGRVQVQTIQQDLGTEFKTKVQEVVESLPTFVPGQDALGNKVSVQFTIPIRFMVR
jgi:protein TonB